MADFFIRRPIVAMVISILTVIVGLITLKGLPISEYPIVSPTLIKVTTTYRGAAAEAVMESVATPIESKVNGVDKLLYMQSFNANDGKLTLNVYFDVGTDVDIMQVNAQNRVGQAEAQLPEAVKKEGVVVDRSSPDILMAIASAQRAWDFFRRKFDFYLVAGFHAGDRPLKSRQQLVLSLDELTEHSNFGPAFPGTGNFV